MFTERDGARPQLRETFTTTNPDDYAGMHKFTPDVGNVFLNFDEIVSYFSIPIHY